ncbi:MAG TPA: glucokinase [Leptolyngbyaceae cyanobacterium]
MTYLLAGDIGGTKTILRLVRVDSGAALAGVQTQMETCYEKMYSSAAFPDLVPMVKTFLQEAEANTGEKQVPDRGCFAIAGPVVDDTSILTNLSWSLSSERLQAELHLDRVRLINDFEAVGYGILGLRPEDLCTLQSGEYLATAPIGVIGAGTGLGQGFLIPLGNSLTVFPTEGGHSDFAPRSELEFQLLKYLLDKHQISRVSVERVVSGQGIVSIYQFLRDRQYATESAEIANVITAWERQTGMQTKTVDPAAAIALAAIEKRDRLSRKTMEIFVEAYGAESGNLALKLLPYGGLYIAGGIAAKNLTLMQDDLFLRAFNQKGRVSHLLEKVPIHIILNSQVGLIGAALCAVRL